MTTNSKSPAEGTMPFWVHLEGNGMTEKVYVVAINEDDAREIAEGLFTELLDIEDWHVADVREASE